MEAFIVDSSRVAGEPIYESIKNLIELSLTFQKVGYNMLIITTINGIELKVDKDSGVNEVYMEYLRKYQELLTFFIGT